MDKKVIEFLIRAKKATYAGKGRESVSSRPNSHDLEYIEDDLLYIDTYLGGAKFSGEEALWRDKVPFWSMNYIGRVLRTEFDGDFLKEALQNVPIDKPYRGPLEYQKNAYKYSCTVDGTFEWFKGYEVISYNNVAIYECYFHGGLVE